MLNGVLPFSFARLATAMFKELLTATVLTGVLSVYLIAFREKSVIVPLAQRVLKGAVWIEQEQSYRVRTRKTVPVPADWTKAITQPTFGPYLSGETRSENPPSTSTRTKARFAPHSVLSAREKLYRARAPRQGSTINRRQ